jgi:hypothetical protein
MEEHAIGRETERLDVVRQSAAPALQGFVDGLLLTGPGALIGTGARSHSRELRRRVGSDPR